MGQRASEGGDISDSVYKVIEVIGASSTSWQEAAKLAVHKVANHLEVVRIAEVVAYRAKMKASFKYHDES